MEVIITMKNIKIEIQKTPDSYDSDHVNFMIDGERKGTGYRAKETGFISIRNCPKCDRENYALNEATGTCAFCGLDANA